MSGCIFCRVVAGDAPATRVYEDDRVFAFLDIRPITRGHTLVIPKIHAGDLDELDAELGADLFRVGHRLAKALRRSDIRADGANLVLNDGKAAFQTVHHVHLHVVPRRGGDLFTFARGFLLRRPHEPETTAAAIRTGLDRLRNAPGDTEETPR
ncbi:HIT domain-containing protein [Nocardia sp. NPDC052254]|uniref:HIT family protein n=1 Tax=Nocardia sp. NPDC052254 TaxID=3155681 RepID=UPI0034184743